MKPYYSLRMLLLPAVALCLIITSCKKESSPKIETDPATATSTGTEHRTVVLQADGRLASPNVEMRVGDLSGSDYSLYPTQELIALSWTINGSPVNMRSMFKFSGIPSGGGQIPPEEAYLTLYSNPTPGNGDLVHANAGPNNAFVIRGVTSSWVPTSTNWFNQPTTTSLGEVSIAHTDSPFLDLINIDVTQLVREMYTTGNYGFMIQLQNEDYWNSRNFCSSSYPDASKRPRLTIVF